MKEEGKISRIVNWSGILKGITAANDKRDKSSQENTLFEQFQWIPQVDETSVKFDDDEDKTMARVTGVYSRQPLDSIEVTNVVATDGRSLISLTSAGESIALITGEPGDSLAHIQGIAGEGPQKRVVFELDFHTDRTFTYVQLGGLDHPDGSDPDDVLNLFFTYNSAGKHLAERALLVQVRDDAPSWHEVAGDTVLQEAGLNGGGGQVELDFGADGPAPTAEFPVVISGVQASANGDLVPLTSGGIPLTLMTDPLDGGKVKAFANDVSVFTDVPVFTLSIAGDGSYLFDQVGPLDHPDDADSNDPLTLIVDMVIKDADGDSSTAQVSIIVLDDGPTADGPVDFPGTILEGVGAENHAAITADFAFELGADGPAATGAYKIKNAMITWGENEQAPLTYGNEQLTFVTDSVHENMVHGQAQGVTVFTLLFDDESDTVSYTQVRGIDHPADVDLVGIDFDVQLVDGDGDKTQTVHFSVEGIEDGQPLAMHDVDTLGTFAVANNQVVWTGGETAGCIVTGLDEDVDPLMTGALFADGLGSDTASVLRSIEHGGVTYTLSEDLSTVNASDPSASFTFDGTTLSFDTTLAGTLSIAMRGAQIGEYVYTAPETFDFSLRHVIAPTDIPSWADISGVDSLGSPVSTITDGSTFSVGGDTTADGEQLVLDFNGRVVASIDVIYSEGTGELGYTLYRSGYDINGATAPYPMFLPGWTGATLSAVDIGIASNRWNGLNFSIEDGSFFDIPGGVASWSNVFTIVDWDEDFTVGKITGGVEKVGGGEIFGWEVPKVTIDTRFGTELELNASGRFAFEFGAEYRDFLYDAIINYTATVSGTASGNEYHLESEAALQSPDVTLSPAAFEAWIDFIAESFLEGTYTARIPYEGITGDIDLTLINSRTELLHAQMDSEGWWTLDAFGFTLIDEDTFGPTEALWELTDGGFNLVNLIPGAAETWADVESITFEIPRSVPLASKMLNKQPWEPIPDWGEVEVYNFLDLAFDDASDTLWEVNPSGLTDGTLHGEERTWILGEYVDLDWVLGFMVDLSMKTAAGNPNLPTYWSTALGGLISSPTGYSLKYDFADFELGWVVGTKMVIDSSPSLFADLTFSRPVLVDLDGDGSYDTDPVSSLTRVAWKDLPDIQAIGADPVRVTPIFYTEGDVVTEMIMTLDLVGKIDVLEFTFDQSHLLAPTLHAGPVATYEKSLLSFDLGPVGGATIPLPDTVYEGAPFYLPDAPNPAPYSGLTSIKLLSDGTGESRVANDYTIRNLVVNLDPEFLGTEQFTYTLEDGDGDTDTANFAVTFDASNLPAPDTITVDRLSVEENSVAGTVVANLQAFAGEVDLRNMGFYELQEDSDGRYAITGNSIVVNLGAHLDYETDSVDQLALSFTDLEGRSFSKDLEIQLIDVNDAPIGVNLTNSTVDENLAGVTIGSLMAVDQDTSDTHSFSVVDGADRFAVALSDGAWTLKLKDGISLDHETADNVDVTVRVADNRGLSFDQRLTVTVGDVNEAPTGLSLDNQFIFANVPPANRPIGTLSTDDVDDGDVFQYSLIVDINDSFLNRFQINDNTLEVKSNAQFTKGEVISVTVRVTDSGDLSYDETLNITVGPVNNPPSPVSFTPEAGFESGIPENTSPFTRIATLSAVDPEGLPVSFQLIAEMVTGFYYNYEGQDQEDSDSLFYIEGDGLYLGMVEDRQTFPDKVLNYEFFTDTDVLLQATDEVGLNSFGSQTMQVLDVNDRPLPADDRIISNATHNDEICIPFAALTANDLDEDDSYLVVTSVGSADYNHMVDVRLSNFESLVLAGGGSNLDWFGFDYSISDGERDSRDDIDEDFSLGFANVTVDSKAMIFGTSYASQILEGTTGPDILVPVSDNTDLPVYLRGLAGDDVLVGGFGDFYNMEGGDGDDLFIFSGVAETSSETGGALALHSVEGGDGFDTLKFSSELFSDTIRQEFGLPLDLVEGLVERTHDVEMLDFEDGRGTSVRIDPEDVIALSGLEFLLSEGQYSNVTWDDDIRSALFITGDAQDKVQLSPEAWHPMETFDGPGGQEYQGLESYVEDGQGGFDNGPLLFVDTRMDFDWLLVT